MSIPNHLGKYEIVDILGKGGMGTVYRAHDPSIDRIVALKTIRRELLDGGNGESMVDRFRNEARAAGRLNHPGIVAIYDFGEDQDVAYIAMEYVDGCGLGQFIKHHDARFPIADVVSIMIQLLEALEYVHQRGVIHRDIKAANLLITASGRLKITDFGIARIDAANLTLVGSIIGTPNAMAPEQFLGREVDHRADLFSAGVVFYELLTGARPFTGPAEAMAYQVCNTEPPAPSSLKADVSVEFDEICARALAKRPEDRYADAEAFCAALRLAYERAFLSPASPLLSEETVVMTAQAVRERLAALKAGAPAAAAQSTSAPSMSVTPTQWQEDTLRTVERQLAAYIGPLARVIVRRAAASSADLGELYGNIQDKLDSDEARKGFRDGLTRVGLKPPAMETAASPGGTSGVAASRTGASGTTGAGITPADLERATKALARHIGPIAGVLVKKAARDVGDLASLHAVLAAKIDGAAAQARFFEDVGRQA
ncbi:serine/threonine-protein kinase [Cognatazoarcus halotolerans]|uniref:serine/threonine-protein kinase n=1 Tax=Cognatazoarcus halotolerans TaxID=2686016 RepID=UPI001359FF3F|nr:serine/threonine-protein kinase [Cognatazoarcus halotolerans]MBX3679369.1 serine/threonine protein kinase [Rhodocyclaceae bacterium]MCB1899851.1 serine/threonine protein kinase [Rhodocyclaceae bacterium]MCP5309341.1 serine/threonine protein kinase [Zoogloeaceae bacterium]